MNNEKRDRIKLFNDDCMNIMKNYPDNYFDLAIVDPPYGINFGEFNRTNKASDGKRYKANKYKNKDWDDAIPDDTYFTELFRVSQNQIVWGGNYFPCLWRYGCKGFVFWYKGNPVANFSDGELAWTSFDRVARQFDYRYYGNLEGKSQAANKIHPTQKPIALYKWIYKNYAKTEFRILDTHLGSGSNAIASYDFGIAEFVGVELDKEYFEDAKKRIENHMAQINLFESEAK